MSRRRGNDYENAVCDMADALGYCSFPARGSRGIVDVVCFESHGNGGYHTIDAMMLPPLAIQVGTTAKAIASTLSELERAPRPIGSLCVVARRHRAKNRRISWTFHSPAGKFTSLEEAIRER